MKVAIMTDTNSGITVEEGKKLGVFVLSMPIIINEKNYLEGINITSRELFSAMRQGYDVSTSQPAPMALIEMWNLIFSQGYDEIVYIPMSSGLSGSCHIAMQLAEEYNGRVQVADNHRISFTQKLSVLDAKYMSNIGMSAVEIRKKLEQNGLHAMIYIAVDTLEYLKKSGRVTKAGAAIATVMNIKPILSIQGDKLDAFAKVRGIQQCQKKMIEALKQDYHTKFSEFPKEKLVIGTAGSFEEEQQEQIWKNQVQEAFPEFDVPYVPLSCSISSHTGWNARGLAIIVKEF
ncbi:MAG: DegV family protein [Oscillospiraceae bacterium]|nr:DegV family protein [Oscillospiraceae bacterium]